MVNASHHTAAQTEPLMSRACTLFSTDCVLQQVAKGAPQGQKWVCHCYDDDTDEQFVIDTGWIINSLNTGRFLMHCVKFICVCVYCNYLRLSCKGVFRYGYCVGGVGELWCSGSCDYGKDGRNTATPQTVGSHDGQ